WQRRYLQALKIIDERQGLAHGILLELHVLTVRPPANGVLGLLAQASEDIVDQAISAANDDLVAGSPSDTHSRAEVLRTGMPDVGGVCQLNVIPERKAGKSPVSWDTWSRLGGRARWGQLAAANEPISRLHIEAVEYALRHMGRR